MVVLLTTSCSYSSQHDTSATPIRLLRLAISMQLKLCKTVHVVTVRRLFLLSVNIAATALTLLTGLRENPVLVLVTGKYDAVGERLRDGDINYDIVRDDSIHVEKLVDLVTAGESYRIFSAPRRGPSNLGDDRSTCVRVNSMNATVMTVNHDDFWGKGPRRTQVFLFSVSAPKCNVLNLKPAWVKNCINSHGNNETSCYRHIMDGFEVLNVDRVIQAGVEKDFGEVGAAFLKCKGWPSRSFQYQTDLMVHQSNCAGGAFHVEIQTSDCRDVPLLRNSDWQWGLFKVEAVDQEADVKIALPLRGWFGYLVTLACGVISMGMIAYGILAVFTRVSNVGYTRQSQRFTKTNAHWMQYLAPSMPIASFFSENENASITFKGSLFMGSDI